MSNDAVKKLASSDTLSVDTDAGDTYSVNIPAGNAAENHQQRQRPAGGHHASSKHQQRSAPAAASAYKDSLLFRTVFISSLLLLSTYVCMSAFWGHETFTIALHQLAGVRKSTTTTNAVVIDDVSSSSSSDLRPVDNDNDIPTDVRHIVFGIASSKKAWPKRRRYVQLWWKPPRPELSLTRRGYVWLDEPLDDDDNSTATPELPDVKLSDDTTSRFEYNYKGGNPAAIRLSRIVSETFRLGLDDVRWFVMGDDDTIFFPENLAMLLRRYDHRKFYYIGMPTESQLQSSRHSFGMAYGGGGYAISFSLAQAMEKMQDGCLQRYAHLYGSDSRIEACAAELGVPLTRALGFHQIDLHGSVFGLLAAHPLAPLVSLHHIDLVDPIFPNRDRQGSLRHLINASLPDPAGILQQSICYDRGRNLTLTVSWGYAVQVFDGFLTPLEAQKPIATFGEWRTSGHDADFFTFGVRQLPSDRRRWPSVFFLEDVHVATTTRGNISVATSATYRLQPVEGCPPRVPGDVIQVFKEKQDESWVEAPRRQCCEVVSTSDIEQYVLKVRQCKENEIIAPQG